MDDTIATACPSCSKAIPRDSLRCPYCEVVLKWALTGELRANWQINLILGPVAFIGSAKRKWIKHQLVSCEVAWDIITIYMGDGTAYKLKRGEYKGSIIRNVSLPFTNVARWELVITPTGGKPIGIQTLLVQYPEGQKSLVKLVNVLGVEKPKWLAALEVLEGVVGGLKRK